MSIDFSLLNLNYSIPISILEKNKNIFKELLVKYCDFKDILDIDIIIKNFKQLEIDQFLNIFNDENDQDEENDEDGFNIFKPSEKICIIELDYMKDNDIISINNFLKKNKIPFDLFIPETEDIYNEKMIYRPENDKILNIPLIEVNDGEELDSYLTFSTIKNIMKNSKDEKEFKEKIQQELNKYNYIPLENY